MQLYMCSIRGLLTCNCGLWSAVADIVSYYYKILIILCCFSIVFLCLSAVCESLKGHKKESRLPLPDALLSSLHLWLCAADRLCQPSYKQQNTAHKLLVQCVPDGIKQLLPKLLRRTKPDKADNLIWRRFTKKVNPQINLNLEQPALPCICVL